MIANDAIRLMSFERHAAYARRHPFLTSVILEQAIDLGKSASVGHPYDRTGRQSGGNQALHDALIPLLLGAATETHSRMAACFNGGDFFGRIC